MIELHVNSLRFSFPEVHERAVFGLEFQRTLRIPDDGADYPLPPGLGAFPLRHVDDFAARVPAAWLRHGGVMLPMYQSEALWIRFHASHRYPFAVKIATGKINAASGEAWQDGLNRDPQDYLVVPNQPWLDGYCVEEGIIRQFVAMPLGAGYSAEEQLTGEAEFGGIQVMAYPLKAEVYERIYAQRGAYLQRGELDVQAVAFAPDMGLAPGGRMRQQIFSDEHKGEDWDLACSSRCFVHILNSLVWLSVTGAVPPTPPPTSEAYSKAGYPWFELYDDEAAALKGADPLAGLKSIVELSGELGDAALPENVSVDPVNVVQLRRGLLPDQVREGEF
jgi:hypothetical protein